MRDEILRLIKMEQGQPCDLLFNDLALRLYRHQYNHNLPYHRFSDLQHQNPETVKSWEAIPALPVTAFKHTDIACRPMNEAVRLFYSSGTTQAQKSRHPLFDLEISRAAILLHFKRHLLPDTDQIRFMILIPSPDEAPNASLSYMMEAVREAYGTEASRYYVEQGQLQSERLAMDMAKTEEPVCLLGTSFSFVHLIDFYRERGSTHLLPPGSRLMDTGGFKGRSHKVSQEWIYARAERDWGIPPGNCINEYGMAEMSSQFYDRIVGKTAPRLFHPPPQVRTRVLSPETLKPVPRGEIGLLAHTDLANIDSAAALLTEDLGREVDGGFLLLGRAGGSEQKGCSLTLDELLVRNLPKISPVSG